MLCPVVNVVWLLPRPPSSGATRSALRPKETLSFGVIIRQRKFLTIDKQLAKRAEIVREKGANRSQFLRGEVDKYTWMDIGSSYIASDLLAAVLLAQLEAMDEITALRRRAYDRYSKGLAPLVDAGTIEVQSIPRHCASNFHLFYLLAEDLQTRTRLIDHLKGHGIRPNPRAIWTGS